MTAMVRLLALALALAGCSELPDLGTCGNGIVEADLGEACDGDVLGEDTCTDSCQLRCIPTPAGDYVSVPTFEPTEQYCPDARMTCALDGICRAPSGQFQATGALQSFDIKAGVAGDFDADGIDDLVGTSATQVVVRLGSTAAPFADGFVQSAPSADAPIAIYDRVPGSRMLDRSNIGLAIPTDGLALMTSNTETFGPQLDTAFEVDEVTLSHFLVRDPTLPNDAGPVPSEAVYGVGRLGNELAVKRVAIAGTSHVEQPLVPCKPAQNQPVSLISVAVAPDSTSFVVVGKGVGNNVFACRYRPKADNSGFDMQLVQQPIAPPDVAVLAQLDNDPCLDLVTADRTGNTVQLRALLGAGPDCALTTAIGPFNATGVGSLLGAGAIVPSGAPARDQLVFETGVFAVDLSGGPDVLTRLAAPTSELNPWTTVGIVDLNGDGQLDVVAGRRGQDDVDIVRGGPVPNVYRADTTAQVARVVDGDFDGDGVGDVALVEAANDQQQLSILYGTREGVVGAPIVTSGVEALLGIARIHRAGWANTRAGSDGVDDLIVIRIDLAAPSTAGLLIGDAARQMTMPRLRTDRDPANPDDFTLGNVAVGPVGGKPIAFTLRPASQAATETALLLTHDLDGNTFSGTETIPTSFRIDTLRQPAFVSTFEPLIAALSVPPTAGSVAQTTTVGLFGVSGTTCVATAPGRPFGVRTRDLDGDGHDEVLVEVVERTVDRDTHILHVLDVAPAGASCMLAESPPVTLDGCVDVVRIDDRLVALCAPAGRFGLYRFDADGARDLDPFVELDGEGLELVAGEFDGDGVADLAVRVRRAAELSVQFVRQCPAHDVRGCQ